MNLDRYDDVKDRLVIQLANRGNVAPDEYHVPIEGTDMAVTFGIEIGEDRNGPVQIPLTEERFAKFGVTGETLYRDALNIAVEDQPVVMCPLVNPEDMCGERMGLYVAFAFGFLDNGAVCLLFPGFMSDAALRTGQGFYILTSSRNELMLIPAADGSKAGWLREMIRGINGNMVRKGDSLSDFMYYCESGRLYLVQEDGTREAVTMPFEELAAVS